jgi:hypothetical protein
VQVLLYLVLPKLRKSVAFRRFLSSHFVLLIDKSNMQMKMIMELCWNDSDRGTEVLKENCVNVTLT